MKNPKLRINRIFTGKVWLQFISMLVAIGVVVAILCFLWWLLGANCQEIIKQFFNPSASWENWEFVHGERAWRPIVGFLGSVLFSGALVAILTNAIIKHREKIQAGEIEYKLKNHVVIIGFDEVVPGLVRQLVRSDTYKDSLILLHSSNPLDEVKDKIHSKLLDKQEKRVVYMHSLHPSKEELSKLHTVDAREIFVVGDRTQNDHDSENMHIMKMLSDIHNQAAAGRKPVVVWFEQETSYAALQRNDVKKAWNDCFDFTPYNFYREWADRLLVSSHYHRGVNKITYPEMDHNGIKADSNKHVHLVVIGMNRMGVAIAKEAAHMLHFPNFDDKTRANQTIITFVDDQADKEMLFFKGRHPGYFEISPTYYFDASKENGRIPEEFPADDVQKKDSNFLDVRFQFLKGRVESPMVQNWLIEQAQDSNQYLTIAVCLHNPSKSLGTGLYLPEELYKKYGDDHYTTIFIRQETSSSMVESLRKAAEEGTNKRYEHIYPFGMVNNSVDLECQDNTMAMAFNYVYDYHSHNQVLPLSLPNKTTLQEQWRTVSVPNQWSNIYLANSFEFKLRSIGYDIQCGVHLSISEADKKDMARTEHNRWNMEKLLIGYRALRREEWDEADKKQGQDGEDYLNALKKNQFVHRCIVPSERKDDKGHGLGNEHRILDENIIETLPMILEYIRN